MWNGPTAWKVGTFRRVQAPGQVDAHCHPGLRYDTEDIIAEGDKVATFVTFSGTHTGPLRDLAPTGRQVSVEQTHWFRLAQGKVAETRSVRDDLGMMQQMKGERSG